MSEDYTLWIHPGDAAARGICEGELVRLESPEGAMDVSVRVTERIIPGTVSFNEGLWPVLRRQKNEIPDQVDQGGGVNILTSTEPTLPSRSSRTHSVFVEVRSRKA
jgi:anaerobic dimethyl sulfoxide reductase subunit A